MPPHPRGRERGQAALEYITVLAVVAGVLAVASAVTAGAAITNAVGTGFQRALCRVTGEACAVVTPRPCTLRTASTDLKAGGQMTFIRVGRLTGILRTESSDGTVTLTLLDKADAGLAAGIGASGRLELGGRDLGVGGLAEATAVAQLGGGRVWKLAGRVAADRLQRRLVEVMVGRAGGSVPVVGPIVSLAQSALAVGSGVALPPPTRRIFSGAMTVTGRLDGPLGSDLTLAGAAVIGGSQDLAAGGGDVYVQLEGSARTALALASLGVGGDVRLALSVDGRGRPKELTLTGRALLTATQIGARLGVDALGVSRDTARGLGGQAVAVLDLGVPENAAAVSRLLRALTPGGRRDLVPAARALGAALADGARVDVAVYGRKEQRYGGRATVGLGAEVGLSLEVLHTRTELLAAASRPPGGVFERRSDCLDRR